MLRAPAILALLALAHAVAAQTTAPSDYKDAVLTGMITCSPDPVSEYCSNIADKFYTVTLDGKEYVLKPGYSDRQMLAMIGTVALSGGHAFLIILHGNVLAHVPPNTPVVMRFHGGGADVGVVKDTKKGPRLYISHYDLAISQIEPVHHPPKGSR